MTLWELAQEMRGIANQLSPGNPLANIVRDTTEVCAERVERWSREADDNHFLFHPSDEGTLVISRKEFRNLIGVPKPEATDDK
jgi:hypothetical protein